MRTAAAIDTLPAAVNVHGGRQLGMPAQVSDSPFVPRTVLSCPFYGVPAVGRLDRRLFARPAIAQADVPLSKRPEVPSQ
jgi:hypothetical protein